MLDRHRQYQALYTHLTVVGFQQATLLSFSSHPELCFALHFQFVPGSHCCCQFGLVGSDHQSCFQRSAWFCPASLILGFQSGHPHTHLQPWECWHWDQSQLQHHSLGLWPWMSAADEMHVVGDLQLERKQSNILTQCSLRLLGSFCWRKDDLWQTPKLCSFCLQVPNL